MFDAQDRLKLAPVAMVRAMAASDSRVGGSCAIAKRILSSGAAREDAKSLTFARIESVAQSVANEIK
jgi:hypothetical protein